ncbi:MAG: PAS domain S-box protein [Bradymonadales bacterium]|nr:PAS domain S-box protein [Bradymonadales bacterium]
MPRDTPHNLLLKYVASLERCRNLEDLYDQIYLYLARMGLGFGTISLMDDDHRVAVVKVSDNCQTGELNRMLQPLGKHFEYLGHTLSIENTVWQGIYQRGQTLASDNILLNREHPNLYQVPWQDCLTQYFQDTPVETLLQMIGIRPVLHAIGVNQIAISPFSVRDQLTGSILIWGSQSHPIDDAHIEVLQAASRIASLAASGILRSQAIKKTLNDVEISETRYTRLVHNAPVGIFEIDFPSNRLKPLNEAATVLTGYNAEELGKIEATQLIADESRKRFEERFNKILKGHVPQVGTEYKIIRKDGRETWVHLRSQVVYQGAKPLRGELFALDVTDLMQTEKSLHHRISVEAVVAKVALAFADLLSPDLALGVGRALEIIGRFGGLQRCYFIQLNPDGTEIEETYEWCEPTLEPQTFRLKEQPIEAMPWWLERLRKFETILIPDVDALPPEAHTEKEILKTHRTPSVLLYPIVAGWGLIGFVGLGASRSLEDWLAEGTRLLSALGDALSGALERRRAERALRESRDRFQAIANAAPDAILLLDESTRVLFCNPAGESLFGLVTAQVSGTPIGEILYPGRYRDLFARIPNELRQDLAEGKTAKLLNLTTLRPGGKEIPIEIALSPMHLQGSWHIVAIARDLSLRPSPAPPSAPLAKGAKPAIPSDNFEVKLMAYTTNNLLTVINHLATLMAAESPPGDARREDIQTILSACQSGYRTNALLLGIPPDEVAAIQCLSFEEILTRVQAFLQPMLPDTIAVEVRLATDLEPIMGDKGQLTQAFINLCLNAAQAMPDGGAITIECRNIKLAPADLVNRPGKRPGTYLLIRIQDTGLGMDRDVLTHATEPFFTTHSDGNALGLGLSMVYGAIEAHQGIVTMESTVGVGTTVTVLLPSAVS